MVNRGSIHWINLDRRRPCVVISSEDVLRADIWQAQVVPLTSNLKRAGLAGNVMLRSTNTGLDSDSVAVPLSLELVDRNWLSEPVGQLTAPLVAEIESGLRKILDL